MIFEIKQNKLTDEVKKKIFDGFGKHAIESTGINGLGNDEGNTVAAKQITRIGVYGIGIQEGKLLVIRQERGPYAGKYDFPGGGIEFGESAEQALRREFLEEVDMSFETLQVVDNLTATIDVPKSPHGEPYTFYQIGMIYQVKGLRCLQSRETNILHYDWIDPNTLTKETCSSLLWLFLKGNMNNFMAKK